MQQQSLLSFFGKPKPAASSASTEGDASQKATADAPGPQPPAPSTPTKTLNNALLGGAASLSPFAQSYLDKLKEESWKKALAGEFKKPYMAKLMKFLEERRQKKALIYPPDELVFNAYNHCSFDKIKVVILGQDPYINPGQAMGLAFSVAPGVAIPPSLRNIYKELADDKEVDFTPPQHGDLTHWADQGVMLLNAVLTVEAGQSNSHAKQGWEEFTDATIKTINEKRKGIVFLLWGKPAQTKGKIVDTKKHHVLTGFFGCRHFSKANGFLKAEGLTPIDWQLPLTEKPTAASVAKRALEEAEAGPEVAAAPPAAKAARVSTEADRR